MYFFRKFEKSKNNMKQTWREINSIIGKVKRQPAQCRFRAENGTIITDSQDISNHFNEFFVNVGPKLASSIQNNGKPYYDYLHNMSSNSLYMQPEPIMESEIIKIMDKFNPNKSAGYDNIGKCIIKKVGEEIANPLANIFNLSLSIGVVPEKLKVAKVIPIYKKSDVEAFSNYRPLPCFSKILERLVLNRCVNYIETNEILKGI